MLACRLDILENIIDSTNQTNAEEGEKLLEYLGLHVHHNHQYVLRVKTELLHLYTFAHKDRSRPLLDRRLQLALDILQVRKYV